MDFKNVLKGVVVWVGERYQTWEIKLVEVKREVKEVATGFGERILEEDQRLKLKELEEKWAKLLLEDEENWCMERQATWIELSI
jgi:hypothetical protein